MFFQGRGSAFLQKLTDGVLGPVEYTLCTDAMSFKQNEQRWSHINKCGAVDVEDASGQTSLSAEGTLVLANMADNIFALGALGIVTPVAAPGTVTAETLPTGIVAGSIWFLGGKKRHRAITALVIVDSASPRTLVADTDYTLDAATGKVTFLTATGTQPYIAAYGYTDPQSVGMFTGATYEWMMSYEFINKQNANKKGSLEIYRMRISPADNLDFQSDKNQDMTLKFSALADLSRDASDTEFGQFGRRVL